jgi:hypothetical protein
MKDFKEYNSSLNAYGGKSYIKNISLNEISHDRKDINNKNFINDIKT